MDAAAVAARCCAGDEEAWGELCALAERALRPRLEWLLRRTKLDTLCDADDVVQLVYERLLEDNRRRLRAFRGKTEEELIRYLRKAAFRQVLDSLRAWGRQQGHFAEYKLALCQHPQTSDDAFILTEERLQAAILDLAAQMPESARRKLRAICDTAAEILPPPSGAGASAGEPSSADAEASCPSSQGHPPSSKDRAHWKKKLYDEFHDLV